MLCAAANLGAKTAIIAKVGRDMHGELLRKTLEEKAVDTSGLVEAGDVFTTLAFVELSATGERKFSFARKPGADTRLEWGEVRKEILNSCRIFHFGSLSLTDEPARTATIEAVKAAKKAGAIISYDPNYRAPLWKSEAEAASRMRVALPLADIVKLSDEETALVTGKSSPEEAARALLSGGASCAVITLGAKGAYAAVKGACVLAPSPKIPVVDTTGAGDSFCGGFLSKLAASGLRPEALDRARLEEFAGFAVKVASLCVQRRGGIKAMPTLAELG
jgi:fructokinase